MGIIPNFNGKAWAGPIANGFEFISTTLLPKSDVLIYSDVNHGNSATIYADMFSKEKLDGYAAQGVTDIYVEQFDGFMIHAQRLAINNNYRSEFIAKLNEYSYSFLTRDQGEQKNADLADAIIAGANTNPPIKFHMVQVSNTPEQNAILDSMFAQASSIHTDALNCFDVFFSSLNDRGIVVGATDIDVIYNMAKYFSMGTDEQKDILDVNKILSQGFKGDIPEDIKMQFAFDLQELKIKQSEILLEQGKLSNQYRIDNDAVLAQNVVDTKTLDGKVIITHGAAHGAVRHNDLDDLLQSAGLSVSRVNIAYDPNDLTLVHGGELVDASDIDYLPKTNAISFFDSNLDGVVNGLSHEITPDGPKHDNAVTMKAF